MSTTAARPATTPDGTPELVRVWLPDGDPWAEVVLVHGLAEHSGRYQRVGEQLAEAGLSVTGFDLIGHGATGGRRGHVANSELYLDQIGVHMEDAVASGRPVALCGHSLGGLLVLSYLLSGRTPSRVAVVSAPALGGGKGWQRLLAPVVGRLLPKLALPTQISGDQLSRDPAVGEAYFADPLVLRRVTARLGAEIFAAADRVRQQLAQLAVPTLVLHGGLDTLVPPTLSVGLESSPLVERRLYLKLRHELFNEPEGPQIVDEVVDWLRHKLG